MALIEVYLDGTLVNEPIDLTKVDEHLYYSEDLSAYLTEIDGSVTFTGTQYDYIREIFDSNVCGSVEIRIYDPTNAEIDFDGIINVADVIYDPDRKFAICEIQNNNITAKIDNNKSIICNLIAGRSKNDITYTVTTTTCTIYDPTGANTVSREGIRIFDAFTSMITFLSDGELGFVSDYFDPSNPQGLPTYSVLMSGLELRTGNGTSIDISFSDLFNDLNALHNLAMSFEDGNIRIEPKDYFKDQTSSVSFDNVRGLSQQLATETLYAKVSFGSAQVSSSFTYLQDIRFNGFGQEEYHLGGQCNTDTELKLQLNKIISDTNIIQDVLPSTGGMGGSGNDNYDDEVLIISCDSANQSVLTLKPASATDSYFNQIYTNKIVAQRWLGQIPQSIYAYLGAGNDGCYINLSSNQNAPVSYSDGLQCDQESPLPWNDVNGNYAIATKWFSSIPQPSGSTLFTNLMTCGFYTAPSNNLYSFELDVRVEFNIPTTTPTMFLTRMVSNSSSGSRENIETFTSTYEGGQVWRIVGGGSFYLNAGDYVGASYIATAPPLSILAGSTFKVSDPLGGVWQTYDASSVYSLENQLTFPINIEDWKTIKQLPFQAMAINHQTGSVDGWLKDISRNLLTGKAEITLLGKPNG